MRYLFFFLFFSFQSLAQTADSLTGPFILDGVVIEEVFCDFDSTVRIYQNSTLVFTDSSFCLYEFRSGKESYLEFIIQTKNCRCRDCEYYKKIIVDLSGLSPLGELTLSHSNLNYIHWNSWIMPEREEMVEGKLRLIGDQMSIELLPYIESDQKLIVDGQKFEMKITKD